MLLSFMAIVMCWSMVHGQALAKEATAIAGVRFNTAEPLADNLRLFLGKDIYVHLNSGKTIQGYVKSVGNGMLHLEKLAGRDFYDALIRIEEISAIEVKFREMK